MTNLQAEYSKIVEQRRHNEEMEAQGASSIREAQRHNVATEQLTQQRNILDQEINMANLANAKWRTEYENEVKKFIAELQNSTNLAKLLQDKELTQAELKVKADQLENQVKQTEAAIDAKIAEIDIQQQNADTAKEKGGYSMIKKIWKDAKNTLGDEVRKRIELLKRLPYLTPSEFIKYAKGGNIGRPGGGSHR